MKKFITSLVFVLVFAMYALSQYFNNSSTLAYTAPGATPTTAANSQPVARVAAPVSVPVSTPAPTTASKPAGQYVDGTYTGSVADAYYGKVQVKATISGGKLADVTFLQYPSDRSTSRFISSQAMPMLTSEAIQAQSAQVDAVSGASDTSAAFRESLGVALSQAKG